MDRILWIGLGGFLGANCRYWFGYWVAERFGPSFPIATLVINTTGSFLLGLVIALTAGRLPVDPAVRLFFAVGFCGGFTTFSTYSLEAHGLLAEGAWLPALLYLAGSVLAGLIAVTTGLLIGHRLAG